MTVEDALARLSVSSSEPSADEPRASTPAPLPAPPPPSSMMALAVQARTLGSMHGNRATAGGDMGAVIEVSARDARSRFRIDSIF